MDNGQAKPYNFPRENERSAVARSLPDAGDGTVELSRSVSDWLPAAKDRYVRRLGKQLVFQLCLFHLLNGPETNVPGPTPPFPL